MPKQKVYIVSLHETFGDWSASYIEKIFSNPEAAEKYKSEQEKKYKEISESSWEKYSIYADEYEVEDS